MTGDLVDRGVLQVDDDGLGADGFEVTRLLGVADQADRRVATLGEQSFEDQGDLAVSAGYDDAHQLFPSVAKTCESSANALNSNAFPAGSSRNIVHCSPGRPAKRR